MRIERVVINASPLITLFRADLHYLLPQLFPDLVVPEAVWEEVVNHPPDDPATQGLPKSHWVRKVATQPNINVFAWGLGAGETAVLSFAQNNRDYTAIIDDRAARRCARVLGVAFMGTAGVLVLAKRRGLIDSVEKSLRRLQRAGLWLSEELIVRLAVEDNAA